MAILETERSFMKNILTEKKIACKRTFQILSSLDESSELTQKTFQQVKYQFDACTSEINSHEALLETTSSRFTFLKSPDFEIFKQNECVSFVCLDWKSAIDLSIIVEMVSLFLPFSLATSAWFTFVTACMLWAVCAYAIVWMKRTNKRLLLTYCKSNILVYPLVVFKFFLSKNFRGVRIIFFVLGYMSGFSVCGKRLVSVLLLEKLAHTQYIYMLELYVLVSVLIIRKTFILNRYKVKRRGEALSSINKQTANVWTCECVCILNRLSNDSFFEVLKIANYSEMNNHVRQCIIHEMEQRKFFSFDCSGYRPSDLSPIGLFANDLKKIKSKLLPTRTGLRIDLVLPVIVLCLFYYFVW